MKSKENVIQTKSYAFSLKIVKMYMRMYKDSEVKDLLRQVLKSGTSIGANVEEAEGGQSKKDFIAKMSIAYKESRETNYWLRLFKDAEILEEAEAESLKQESEELMRIMTAILNTSKRA